jgi:hypothetical protein
MATVTTPSKYYTQFYSTRIQTPPTIKLRPALPVALDKQQWWRKDVSATYNGSAFLGLNRAGVVSGKVTLDETPVVGAEVFLFSLPAMILIRTGRADKNGNYSFDGLDKTSNKYIAVARIPPHNAMALDILTPA